MEENDFTPRGAPPRLTKMRVAPLEMFSAYFLSLCHFGGLDSKVPKTTAEQSQQVAGKKITKQLVLVRHVHYTASEWPEFCTCSRHLHRSRRTNRENRYFTQSTGGRSRQSLDGRSIHSIGAFNSSLWPQLTDNPRRLSGERHRHLSAADTERL